MALTDQRVRTSAASTVHGVGAPPVRRPSRLPRARRVQLLLVQATLMAALASLHVLLLDFSWWVAGAFASAVVLGVAALLRSRSRRAVWPSVGALAAGVLLMTAMFVPGTAILGFIPTVDSLSALVTVVQSGISSIAEQSVPASPEPGIVLLLVIFMIVSAWFAEIFITAETPALVALPVGGILVVPVAIRSGLADPLWFVVAIALYLLMLRVGRRADSRRIVGFVAVLTLAGALIAPALLPGVGEVVGASGSGFRTGINPLVSLGDDLRRGEPIRVLSYTTDSEGPVYLRLATMEDFSGSRWEPTASESTGPDLEAFPEPPGLARDVEQWTSNVDVQVGQLTSRWLPLPYPATSVTGVEGDFFWVPDSLAVRSGDASARGQGYSAAFLELAPSAAQFVAAGAGEAPTGTLDLPSLPGNIVDTAFEVAGDAPSSYQQALALQSFLRAPPFRYSETTPVREGFDGTSIDAISQFLEVQSGYCVHYASAMAVMARVLGIPSRLAVGFQPGSQRIDEGAVSYTLTTDDLHAWPELYFEGVGWMRFEPTPGRGSVPSYVDAAVDDPLTPEDESTASPTAAPAPTSTAVPGQPQTDQQAGAETDSAAGADSGISAVVAWTVAGGVLLVVAIPALVRTGIRASRISRLRRGPDAAAAAWEELRDTARDHGWTAPESETPRAFAERLAAAIDDGEGAIAAFRASVEVSAFARDDPPLSAHDLAQARRAIIESSRMGTRALAVLLPASLMFRWKPPELG